MPTSFIDPGRFRTELALEQASATEDGMGGQVEAWSETATVMALVEPVSAADAWLADARAEAVTHRVTIRRRAGVAAGMRFRRGTRLMTVRTVHDPDETGRYLVCRCREERR